MDECENVLPRFREIIKSIWGESAAKELEIKCEPKIGMERSTDAGLAGIRYPPNCKPVAIDDSLLRYCIPYTLLISPKFSEISKEKQDKVLKHEALHLGYPGHGKEFLRIASKHGAPFSEYSLNSCKISIQVKSNGRYKEIMCSSDYDDAVEKAKEYKKQHPEQKVRLNM
jgi:hypothetical protein